MNTKIFVNLPVKDLAVSIDFFSKLGYAVNPQFTNDAAACLVINDNIYAMLVTHEFFATFTKKPMADAFSVTETINALSLDARADVDIMTEKALAAGATEFRDPQDYEGFMYSRGIQDLDGHQWEFFWMDEVVAKTHYENKDK